MWTIKLKWCLDWHQFLSYPTGLVKEKPQDTIHMSFWSCCLGLEFMIIYIDDILVYSKFVEEHVRHLEFVLQKFKKNKLYTN
jgi:hypothetical protein